MGVSFYCTLVFTECLFIVRSFLRATLFAIFLQKRLESFGHKAIFFIGQIVCIFSCVRTKGICTDCTCRENVVLGSFFPSNARD